MKGKKKEYNRGWSDGHLEATKEGNQLFEVMDKKHKKEIKKLQKKIEELYEAIEAEVAGRAEE